MENYEKYLEIGLKASKLAEDIIVKAYTKGLINFESKSDKTPVTEIDKQCEAIIKSAILESFPDHAFLGEETGKSNNSSEFVWIIDPIDGTKNFIRGIPLFGSLIALRHNTKLVVGISNAPMMGECLYAYDSHGAYKNGNRIHTSKCKTLDQSYISHGGIKSFINKNIINNLGELSGSVWGGRNFGDAWAYHLVAEGKIEANLEASLKIWDIAAASVIIKEAGGEVSDLNGHEINLDTTSFLSSNGYVHRQILDIFKTK